MTRLLSAGRWLAAGSGAALTLWLSVWTVVGSSDPWNAIVPLATLPAALVVLLRRDWHSVGWLLLLSAVINAAQFGESLPLMGAAWQAWLFTVLNVAFWAVMASLVAVFPDGVARQHGGFRIVDRGVVAVSGVATLLSAFPAQVAAAGWSGSGDPPMYDNPLGLGWWAPASGTGEALTLVTLAAFAVATVTLSLRTRRAEGATRQQLKWVLFPFGILVVGVPIAITISVIRGEPGPEWYVAILGYIAIPIAFGVAMTRYRLYEIEKVISRTVAYSLVVAMLGLGYVGMVTLISTFVPAGNSVAVAASTLAIAAVFNPLRRRVQRWVDRRFHRSAFDAEEVAREFSSRIQGSLSIDELATVWSECVTDYLRPSSTGVWLRVLDAVGVATVSTADR
ncbi:MAG: hypothetical protein R3246_12455 [Acidimicrobiia bacterium]|nr:hypothetical protein [Acidimicrobiia bacterium]